jgi:hypothetical protein
MRDRIIDWIFVLLASIVGGVVFLASPYGGQLFSPKAEPMDCCKHLKPEPAPKDGLQLHTWYRAKSDVSWDWSARVWKAGLNGRGVVLKGTPLYVVERKTHVAVLRGAVRGEILVPDGASTWLFSRLAPGEIGEEMPPIPMKQAEFNEFCLAFQRRETAQFACYSPLTGAKIWP